jgi:hypothetical protein
MTRKFLIATLTAMVLLPASVPAFQRFRRGAFRADIVTPAQLWRLPDLTLEQRIELGKLLSSNLGSARLRRGNVAELLDDVRRIVGPGNYERARQLDRRPLSPVEYLYYSVTSLRDLDAESRAKVDAVFAALMRRERVGNSADAEGTRRQRVGAAFEVLEALLTPQQLRAVRGLTPRRARNASFREQEVMRLPSLTLEQETRARAIFAALEDETTADRARLDVLRAEARGAKAGMRRGDKRDEFLDIQQRIDARTAAAREDLGKVLSPEQMMALEVSRPGPPRPVVFNLRAIRSLDLSAQQEAVLRPALHDFMSKTADDRARLRVIRKEAKDEDLRSMEMAPVRDQLRRAAQEIEPAREKLVRLVADTLTREQLVALVERVLSAKGAERP